MPKKKKDSTELSLIETKNQFSPKSFKSKLKLRCKKVYAKANELFIKSKPIIKLTDIYLTCSSVIKLFMDIFMIYTFGNAGLVYYIY
jgi:hypothetical protein